MTVYSRLSKVVKQAEVEQSQQTKRRMKLELNEQLTHRVADQAVLV